MEASALQAPAGLARISLGPLLRLKSDEQLVALFRSGSEDAFSHLVDRYQQRLFAYTRQMLGGSRQDAEDVLQDVFVRAYGALRADDREINVRAWLYRVAHNRCIDQLRRATPAASEIFDMSRKPLHDPFEQAQRREDLRRLVEDVSRLPEQQRSALLMREIDGMSYADLADALDTSVAAVKSLLVRARIGLVEAVEARDMDCTVIRTDLMAAYDRGVKASGRARRHMRECDGCREYRTALRGVRRSFAALAPVGFGPLALAAHALGIGGAGGGAAASAGAGGSIAATTGVGAVSACKVAAVVCTAAIATGGAVEVRHLASGPAGPSPERSSATASHGARSAPSATAGTARSAPAPVVQDDRLTRAPLAAAPSASARERKRKRAAARRERRSEAGTPAPAIADPATPGAGLPTTGTGETPVSGGGTATDQPTGGASAPSGAETGSSAQPVTDGAQPTDGALPVTPGTGASTGTLPQDPAHAGAGTSPGGAPASPTAPPPEH